MSARYVQFFLTVLLAAVCFNVTAESFDIKIAADASNSKVKEIAFVDAGVKNTDSLLREIDPHVDVVVIDSQRDGVEQIAEILATQKDISAIHILSHGRSGVLDLGATKLSAASIVSNHSDELAIIRGALSQNADILIYGCNFGQDATGARAVELLAEATGADVVASDNMTGAAVLGGDWDMEIRSGTIETAQISAEGWDGVLAPFIINVQGITPTVSGTGVGDTALWLNAGTVGGTAIDLKATIISGTGTSVVFSNSTTGNGSNPKVRTLSTVETTIKWEAFENSDGVTPIEGDPTFLLLDIDGAGGIPESVETVAAGAVGLTSYTVAGPLPTSTDLVISSVNGTVRASGTLDAPNAQSTTFEQAWVSFSWEGVSSWEVTYKSEVSTAKDYIHDGDGEFTFTTPNTSLVGDFTIDAIANANVDENLAYTGVTPAITGTPIGALTYSLSGADALDFTIAPLTGVVSMVARNFEAPVDADTNNVYALTITATDTGANTATQSWTVTVNDVTEAASFTIDAIANANVDENLAYTGVTPAITGTPIGAVTYSLSGADALDFTIAPLTGVVSMVARNFEAPVDADTNNVYALTITATDTDANTATQSWTVTVNDVAEAASFTIDAIANANVDENLAYTGVTPAITGTPIGAVTYSLSGADALDFTIAPLTGVVSMVARNFEAPVDADTNNVYALTITATDTDANTATQSWTVTVNDVTEAASFTIDAITNANVDENLAYTGVTPAITGTPIGAVTYSLSGADALDFTIAPLTGVVSMVARNFEAPVDADTNNVYALTITATDTDANTATQSWTVTVNDVTEAASFTIDAIGNANVNENLAYTGVTPAITGTPIGAVTYSLSGADALDFTIAPLTGVVSMVARNFEAPVDADTNNVYALTITATDTDANTATQSWTVTVNDVTEAASFTIDAIGNANVNENLAYTGVTPAITGTPIGAVTYSLSGADALDFTIAPLTGVVSMVARNFEAPVDADTNNVYALTITATDTDANTATQSWTVTVNDVTEAASFTIDAITNANVDENLAYTGVTPAITGTPIGAVTYSLSGADALDFTIAPLTGVVSMVARNFEAPVDADTNNVYALTITATDTDANTATQSWTVTVNDVAEAASFTIDAIANANVDENLAYTGVTPAITGTPIGAVTYSLSGADALDFTIAPLTGVVSMVARNFEAPVDADTNNVYALTITATDTDANTATQSWTVTVNDVTEAASFTIDAITNANVDENLAYTGVTPAITGTPIGAVTYSLSGADALDFTIAPLTGVVSMVARNFEAPVDADTNNVYALTITATDTDANTATQSWTVTVNDVTEAASFTIDAIGNANVNENLAYTGVTPAITGTPIGAVTYSLSGADALDFTIAPLTGVVSMVARNFEAPVDADTNNVYALTITATDTDANTATQSWTVTVNDVTEAASFTIDAITNANVDENLAYTGVTPAITGTPIGAVTYSLSGADALDFTIAPLTGVVSMVARNFEAPVDADTNNVYALTITATDTDANTATQSWTVTVNDVTEAASFTIDAIGNANVNENLAYTSVTPNLSGATPIGAVTYSLSGADALDFTIAPLTGVVSMVARDFEAPVDANTDNVYAVTITATDADGNNDSEVWNVTVQDVVETATFTINAIGNASVNENLAYTGVTPAITGTPIGAVTYSLSGADALDFTIAPLTGVVSMVARDFEAPVDADTNNVYALTITATDTDTNTATQSWTVTVNDVTEAASFTIDAIGNANVNENLAYTSVTPNLSGATPIGAVTYSLSGADALDFTIAPLTGVVSMVARDFEAPVDANTDNVYAVTITATDADGNNDSEVWNVTVQDVVETATFTINAIGNASVNENLAYTGVTPAITGTPIGAVTYSLSGADALDFTIAPLTGVVSMVARDFEAPVDADTNNVYALTITATDTDTNTATQSWTVTVNDVTEAASFTIDAIANANVNENLAYTSVTPNLSGATPIGAVTYSLSGADALDFTIAPLTGVVSMVARDFEAPVDANTDNVYAVTITATDADGNNDSEVWNVTVQDVVETATFTINAIGNASVNENLAYTGVTPAITGTPIGAVTYSLSGADALDFTIAPLTGVVSMVARDFENPADTGANNVYDLSITATDADGNADSEAWSVTVNDVIETASFSINAIANASVNENLAYTGVTPAITGAPIGALTYTLSGADALDFTINASTGVVSMVARNFEAPVDADTNNVYALTITATDTDANTATQSWTVTVNDVVETASFSINAIANATVAENSVYTGVSPAITGAPIGVVTYSLGGTDAGDFTINASTGVVSMVARNFEGPVDADTNNVYALTITATDTDANAATQSWTVTVNDVTEIADTDGIPDSVECSVFPSVCPDSDGDGLPDYIDDDSDNDGIPDAVEAGVDPTQPLDTDGDGTPDYQDTDSDEDGALDSAEGNADADGDGIPDYLDAASAGPGLFAGDSDGDGLLDNIECELYPLCADSDADRTPDYMEADSDNDGIPDATEANASGTDTDVDGIDDNFDIDSFTPGVDALDLNADGIIDTHPLDSDGDGTPDYQDTDSDDDGTNDVTEGLVDTDGDGVPDRVDVDAAGPGAGDSDGDTITDDVECLAYPACADGDGDGKPDYLDANDENGPLGNIDGDGTLNYLDSDDDGDVIPDNVEDLNFDADNNPFTNPYDTDGDGIPDYQDSDSDEDGAPDSAEGIADTDGDGIPDYVDVASAGPGAGDSDGDGALDSAECTAYPACASSDSDNDGVPNYMDADSTPVVRVIPQSSGGGGGSNSPVYMLLLLLTLVTVRYKQRTAH